LNFANLPHDVAETLELVFVSITIVATLAVLVVFGRWWQR
jgi:ABC-type arginine/histidine transport system permease subunit